MIAELLAPAGDLKRLKVAVDYGADAVFIGGKQFSLRAKASNFDLDDIAEGAKYCHDHGSRLHVTVNMIPHDDDYAGLEDYLRSLESIGVDAVIVASMSIVALAKAVAPGLEVHVSTQYSSTNSMSVNFWKRRGADRVVLGRECTLEEVKSICRNTDIPIEAFIHGGMCTNYSGRCTLSNYMTLRDANRGGCAQSCRWKYEVYQGDRLISDKQTPFSMSSKDLNATAVVKDLIEAGVCSFKIEGRMKTEYYIATVVSSYRMLIDAVLDGSYSEELLKRVQANLMMAENRETSIGYYYGEPDHEGYLYGVNGAVVNQDFLGVVREMSDQFALIEVRNHFSVGERIEILDPSMDLATFMVEQLIDSQDVETDRVYKPMEVIKLRTPVPLVKNSFIRRAR